MAHNSRKPLLVTLGDPAGIGPEITVKTWQALRTSAEHCFAVVAPEPVLARALAAADAPPARIISDLSEAAEIFEHHLPILSLDGVDISPGRPSPKAAPMITNSIETSVRLCLNHHADAVITNPIAKHILYEAGFTFPGHTEYLGALTQDTPHNPPRGPVMMLEGGGLRVALATVHLPLAEAAKCLNKNAIIKNAQVMDQALRQDFGISNPRIALTGLNPHAGEGGALGQEEIDIINPAAEALRTQGINITDAQSADTLFHSEARAGYDAVLAMYHDQGLIPVKTLDFHGGVNITLGLPVVRTSPDHGTAFGIAGKNIARPDSLIAAVKSARRIADNRHRYRENG